MKPKWVYVSLAKKVRSNGTICDRGNCGSRASTSRRRSIPTNRDYLYPAAKELCRLPSGHIEGFYEAFGNLYRGFCMNLIAKKTGGDPGSFRYPTVEDGVRGIEFVDACLKSNANNNVWVPIEHE